MAVKLDINAELDTKDVTSQLDKLNKKLEGVEKEMQDIKKTSKETTSAIKDSTKATNGLATGFKGVGLAIKAAGIGLLIGVLNQVMELFKQNQKVVDVFTTAFNFLSNVVNDFIDFITGEGIDAVKRFFQEFEFSAAYFAQTAAGIAQYTEETYEAAKAQTELANSSVLAQAEIRRSIEQYDRDAELLRQIRDDETKTFEQRIKANEDLALLLEKQAEEELKLAKISVDAAKAALDANETNIELQAAYIDALAEQDAVLARVTGFQSEQLINRNSLQREYNEYLKENTRLQREQLETINPSGATDIESDPEVVRARKSAEVRLGINKDLNANLMKQDKSKSKFEVELEEKKIGIARNAANAALALAEQGSAEFKAIASAQVLFDTFRGIQAAFASNAANTGAVIATSGAWPFIQAASAAAFGFANLAAINAAPIKGASGAAGGIPRGSSSVPQADENRVPDFGFANLGVGGTQNAEFGANRSYIVLQDLRDKESLDERIRDSARLG